MTIRKADIKRPDKRIAATAQTLAYLFDVSVSQIEKAVAEGTIKPREVFGAKRFHVESIERAFFGEASKSSDGSSDEDPFLAALRGQDGSPSKKRRDPAA